MTTKFRFQGEVKEPFLLKGEIGIKGWEIPILYAIDSNNRCWIGNGHSFTLYVCEEYMFIKILEKEDIKVLVEAKKILGLELIPCPCPLCDGKGTILM